MKLNNKIPAFTLSEISVTLVLTSIVVGLVFSVLSLVQKQLFGIQQNLNVNAELQLLEQSLWLDFNRFENVQYDGINNQIKLKTELDSVVYDFQKESVIKQEDTFDLSLSIEKLFFNGVSVENGYIDAIKLKTDDKHKENLFIFKSKSANDFVD